VKMTRIGGGLLLLGAMSFSGFFLVQLEHRADRTMSAVQSALLAGKSKADELATEVRPSDITIHFDRGMRPKSLGYGWSEAEQGFGVWSLGRLAVVKLQAFPAAPSTDVALTLQAFIAPGHPVQKVRVRAGDRVLAEWSLTNTDVRTVHVLVPRGVQAPNGDFELQLDLPDAAQPAKAIAGSTDPRILAINLKTIEVSS
jgi:hypothetical protein